MPIISEAGLDIPSSSFELGRLYLHSLNINVTDNISLAQVKNFKKDCKGFLTLSNVIDDIRQNNLLCVRATGEMSLADLIHRLFGLSDAVALVTGSSAGIGLALARGLGGAGARVVVNGRTEKTVDAAAEALRSEGVEVHAAPFDVTKRAEVSEAIARIESEFGPIEILVNNAGIQRRGPLEDYPEETWSEIMSANLDSVFYVSQAAARYMITRKRGSIINIGSVQCDLARMNIAPYTASKGGVKMLTKGMATDWGKHGLRINAVAPGYFRTDLNKALVEDEKFSAWLTARTPMARWGDVDELVGAAIFLASNASSFVNGHILFVDGGITACL